MSSSKSSNQRQREIETSNLKSEEPGKQHEAELRIARRRLKIEKQIQLRQLQIQQPD